jgi:uncharacterized protein (TIGR02569 family)
MVPQRKKIKIPSTDVLHAFGATESPILLTGGQGQTFRSDNVVLKPAIDDESTNWIANFYLTTNCDGFRLPKPIRSNNGGFVYAGWQAWEYIPGQHKKKRWIEEIELCAKFHKLIADIPRPLCFDRLDMNNPWVIADKVAWDELEFEHHPKIAPAVEQLRKCLRAVNEKSQLIHGDFGGNILYSDVLPPTIIDFSPSWRPAEVAIGILIADAIVWEGANESLIEAGNQFNNFYQHLARAELRRVIELDALYQIYGWEMLDEIEAHLPLIRAISKRCN